MNIRFNQLHKNVLCVTALLCLSASLVNAKSISEIFKPNLNQKNLISVNTFTPFESTLQPQESPSRGNVGVYTPQTTQKNMIDDVFTPDIPLETHTPVITPVTKESTQAPKEQLSLPPQDDVPVFREIKSVQEESPPIRTEKNAVTIKKDAKTSPKTRGDYDVFTSIVKQMSGGSANTETEQSTVNTFSKIETPPQTETSEPYQVQAEVNDADGNEIVDMTTPVEEEIDYDGLTISQVGFTGLQTINESEIQNLVQTKSNTVYDKDVLQSDLQAIYNTGYFTDKIAIEQELLEDNTVKLNFSLQENIIVNHIEFKGNKVCQTGELLKIANCLKGKPQNIKTINEVIAEISEYYKEKGYILAKVASVDDNTDGNLIFTIHEGIVKEISIEGNTKTKDFVVRRNIITRVGDVYNEECINEDLQRIFATQVFEDINKNITETEDGSGLYKVAIVVKEGQKLNGVSVGGGVDSGIGIFGEVGIFDNNFLGRAQRVSLNGLIGSGIMLNDSSIKNRVNYQAELNFFEPYLFNSDNSLASKLYIRELGSYQIPLAIERRIGVNAQLQHNFKSFEHLKGTFDLGVEHIGLKEGDRDKIYSLYAEKGIDISKRAKQLQGGFFVNLAPGLVYKNVDADINPRNGIIAEVKLNQAISLSDLKQSNTRLSGAITKFIPIAKKSSVSFTAKAGTKIAGSDMPEIFAYRLGGPYTIRGFRTSGVGSGESFIMGSAEFATPVFGLDRLKYEFLKNMRLCFFVDAGQLFNGTLTSDLYDRPMHAITIGVGLKVNLPGIGPLSVDYGLPITNAGRYNSQRGYFTFGSSYFGNNW